MLFRTQCKRWRQKWQNRPRSEVVATRLAEVLFIQVLGAHIASVPKRNKGWLRAVFDPQMGTALSAFHDRVNTPWKVESLAEAAGMSRSAFAARFKAGSHAFRRFRNTYLKNETSCPKGLRDYWLRHAGNSMDDLYDMVKDNAVLRKKKAEEYSIGFEIPGSVSSVVPNVPKKQRKHSSVKAA